MQSLPIPLVLRLAGCWIIWSAWCSVSGWFLSIVHELDGLGYIILLPALIGCLWRWITLTTPARSPVSNPVEKIIRRLRRPAALIYLAIVLLSLAAGALYEPWSIDAVSYRLPRILYWWQTHHWYWIGTLDHRLDYSSTGFEWQMLPVIMLTHTDRLLFLLNWLPYLLMPGLTFLSFHGLGVSARSARRWMWLMPSGYCYALQCSGWQNDGYTVNYTLAAVAFAVNGYRSKRQWPVLLSMLAVALLTGAKLSNLPLLLPMGVLLWPVLRRVPIFNWKTPAVSAVAVFCSFLPLAFLCWKITGDWTGDPTDQWNIKTHGPAEAAIIANLIILLYNSFQPPYLPASQHVNNLFGGINHTSFIHWLERYHGEFSGIHFGTMAYEGLASVGFGLALYTVFLFFGTRFFPLRNQAKTPKAPMPFEWFLVPWLVWLAYLVFLSKLGSYTSSRIAAPYYPLLFIPLLRSYQVKIFERKKMAGVLAGLAAATVLPVIILTPARPLFPFQTLARIVHRPGVEHVAEGYQFWNTLRDDLAPLRTHLPADATRLGYGAGLEDTPYGLFKPLGARTIVELGLPIGSHAMPPAGLKYAIVTDQGLKQRYGTDLQTWLGLVHGRVIFQCSRNVALSVREETQMETWYLVQLDTQQNRR